MILIFMRIFMRPISNMEDRIGLLATMQVYAMSWLICYQSLRVIQMNLKIHIIAFTLVFLLLSEQPNLLSYKQAILNAFKDPAVDSLTRLFPGKIIVIIAQVILF